MLIFGPVSVILHLQVKMHFLCNEDAEIQLEIRFWVLSSITLSITDFATISEQIVNCIFGDCLRQTRRQYPSKSI